MSAMTEPGRHADAHHLRCRVRGAMEFIEWLRAQDLHVTAINLTVPAGRLGDAEVAQLVLNWAKVHADHELVTEVRALIEGMLSAASTASTARTSRSTE